MGPEPFPVAVNLIANIGNFIVEDLVSGHKRTWLGKPVQIGHEGGPSGRAQGICSGSKWLGLIFIQNYGFLDDLMLFNFFNSLEMRCR